MGNIKYHISRIDNSKNLMPDLLSIPKKIEKFPEQLFLDDKFFTNN